ncbi:MAG: hypothetical protein Kow00109_16580 [Acidobacteriota bacterium]
MLPKAEPAESRAPRRPEHHPARDENAGSEAAGRLGSRRRAPDCVEYRPNQTGNWEKTERSLAWFPGGQIGRGASGAVAADGIFPPPAVSFPFKGKRLGRPGAGERTFLVESLGRSERR